MTYPTLLYTVNAGEHDCSNNLIYGVYTAINSNMPKI